MIESEALRIREITARLAALVEPVVTSYPVSDGQPMVDLAASRSAEIPTHAGDRVSRIIPRPRSLNDPRPARSSEETDAPTSPPPAAPPGS